MELRDFKRLNSFTAIDFETAHSQHWSICQAGLVVVEDGRITKELEILVQPPGNRYHWGNSRVHGIKAISTRNAPLFPEVWGQMVPHIAGKNLVAHNATFDCSCLRATLDYYKLPQIPFKKYCTVKIYNKNLAALCQEHQIELKHHNALSDARACAMLFLKHLNATG